VEGLYVITPTGFCERHVCACVGPAGEGLTGTRWFGVLWKREWMELGCGKGRRRAVRMGSYYAIDHFRNQVFAGGHVSFKQVSWYLRLPFCYFEFSSTFSKF